MFIQNESPFCIDNMIQSDILKLNLIDNESHY